MSFLPYAETRRASWLASFWGSTFLHAGLIAGLVYASQNLIDFVREEGVNSPSFDISFETFTPEVEIDDGLPDLSEIPDAPTEEMDVLEAEDTLDDTAEIEAAEDVALAEELETFDDTDTLIEEETTETLAAEPVEQIATAEDAEADTLAETLPEEPLNLDVDIAEPAPVIEETLPEEAPIELAESIEAAPQELALVAEEETLILAEDGTAPSLDAEVPLTDLAVITAEPDTPEILSLDAETLDDGAEIAALLDETPIEEPEIEALGEDESETLIPDIVEEPALDLVEETTDAVAAIIEEPTGTSDGRQLLNQPSPQIIALSNLITAIRQAPLAPCQIAIPRRLQGGGVGLSLLGTSDDAMGAYFSSLPAEATTDVERFQTRVNDAQCAGLDILQKTAAYPTNRIGIALADASLQSGGVLEARIGGFAKQYVSAMIVDDLGIAQDLGRFMALDGDGITLKAPVLRQGGVKNAEQLLIVFASDDEIFLSENDRRPIDAFNAALTKERLTGTHFGIASFTVE